MATLAPVRLSTAELRDARLSGRHGPPTLTPATRPAAPPGLRSPDGAIGARAHGLQVLVHGAHLPGRLGHLLAVKALAGGRRRAHGRRGRRPRQRPRGHRAPRTGLRDRRNPPGVCPRPPRGCSAPGSSLRLPEPPTPTPTRARPQASLGSARPLPCLRTNRPPGRAHVTPPAARRPLRKPEAAARGEGLRRGGRMGSASRSSSPAWNRARRLRPRPPLHSGRAPQRWVGDGLAPAPLRSPY